MYKLPRAASTLYTRQLSLSHSNRNVRCPKPEYGPLEVMRSDLMNGIKVACAKPLGSQIGACTIMFQAGSRFEAGEQLGASHFLRAMSGGSGCGYSSFMKSRYLPQSGASMTCTSDRQSIAYTLRCPISLFSDLKSYLVDAAIRCCYHPWELEDQKPFVRDDLSRIPPEQRTMDLIQNAAFRGPLANSVFCEEARISDMSHDSLASFVQTNFLPVRCSVGSVGLPFDEILKMAERIELRRERPPDPCTVSSYPRAGYEFYDLGPGSDTWIALAVPGSGSCDVKSLFKHAIIAAACGTGNVQMGQHTMDRTPQSPLGTMARDDVYTDYKAFNISYFDHGIFGILVRTRAQAAEQAARCAAQFLVNVGDLNIKQIEVGKRRLKMSLALHDEDCVRMSEGLALQSANYVQIDNASTSFGVIDSIPAEEVCAAAKTLSCKKDYMSLAVVGDVGAVPPGRELLLL